MTRTHIGLILALGAIALMPGGNLAQAGTMNFVSGLSATTPTTINEGQSVSVLATYQLTHTGTAAGNTGHFYYNWVRFHSGDGQQVRDWANGRDYSGSQYWSGNIGAIVGGEPHNPQVQPGGWPGNTNASPGRNQSFNASFTYADDGNFTLNAHGDTAIGPTFGLHAQAALWLSTGGTPGSGFQGPVFNRSLSIAVLNVAPTITSAPGDSAQDAGVPFSLSASATDPGVLDLLTFEWDLTGDGVYDDYVHTPGAGGAQSSSTNATLSAAGVYILGLRVSDGDGGSAIHSFEVTVVPEPSALLLGALGAGIVLTSRRRRNQK